jgi:hypothetical protein
MDRVWDPLRATKANNLSLHVASLQKMIQLFFSYDHHNYARYSAVYFQTMLNHPTTRPGAETLLREKGFSVNMSSVSGSRCAVDMMIEQTINKHAKSQGEIIDSSRNLSAYYRWCTTRHARGLYHQAALERADMDDHDSSAHKDPRCSQITQSEEDTIKVIQAVQNFVNRFKFENKNELYCLSSETSAPQKKSCE